MVYFTAQNKDEEPNENTLRGRQALLNYQFDILTYQRDAITMLDTLNTIKDDVQSIDKKVDDNLGMIRTTTMTSKRLKSAKHSNSNQGIYEEQKIVGEDSF